MGPSDTVVTLLLAQAELCSTPSSPASEPEPVRSGYVRGGSFAQVSVHHSEKVVANCPTFLLLLLNHFKPLPCSRTGGAAGTLCAEDLPVVVAAGTADCQPLCATTQGSQSTKALRT